MKKLISLSLSLIITALFSFSCFASEKPSEIFSEAVCLMDASTGQVLFQKNMNRIMEPASITKIMTSALALEKGIKDTDTVEMNDDSIWSVGRNTTHVALTPGEIVPVKDILYGTMLQSANDCANGLALFVDGDLEKFAKRMTDKAHELGAVNTNFVNANGLPNPKHVTTAYDMALITKWAITVPGFREVFGTPEYTMAPTNLQPEERNFYHGHKSLNQYSSFYYEYATGGKTGWTEEARNTAVTLAKKDDMELICVTLHAQEAKGRYTDIITCFDYGFKNFNRADFSSERFSLDPIPVYDNDTKVGDVTIIPKDVSIAKPSTAAKADIKIEMNLPIRYSVSDEIAPEASFILNDKVITTVPFDYVKNIEQKKPVVLNADAENGNGGKGKIKIIPIICFILAPVFLLIAVLFAIRSRNILKYNKRVERLNRQDERKKARERQERNRY